MLNFYKKYKQSYLLAITAGFLLLAPLKVAAQADAAAFAQGLESLQSIQKWYDDKEPIKNQKKVIDSLGYHVYPMIHIVDDTALMPYLLELYISKRTQRVEPYLEVWINCKPKNNVWYDFTQYTFSVKLEQGKTKIVPTESIKLAEKNINVVLAQIGTLSDFLSKFSGAFSDAFKSMRNTDNTVPIIRFAPTAEKSNSFFDAPGREALKSYYEKYDRADSTVLIPWKLLGKAGDKIIGKVEIKDTSNRTSNILFRNKANSQLAATYDKDQFIVNLIGTGVKSEDEVTAYYKKKMPNGTDKEIGIGSIAIQQYPQEPKQLVIVPTNGLSVSSDIIAEIKTIYQQALVDWTVTVEDKSFNIDASLYQTEGASDNTISIETGMFDAYTGETEAINEAYAKFKGDKLDSKTNYLFVTAVPNDQSFNGYMPLGGQFGYIFTSHGGNSGQTMAHELGHGAFSLKHTSDEFGIGQNTTGNDNLMGYNGGTMLWKPQWDQIHDPSFRLNWFRKASDGAMLEPNYRTLAELGITETGEINFVRPDGKIITLETSKLSKVDFSQEYIYIGTNQLAQKSSRNSTGVLSSFYYDKEAYYTNNIGLSFKGYYPKDSRDNNGNLIDSKRFDKDNSTYLRNSTQKTVKVYIGVETETCKLDIKSGQYSSTHISNSDLCTKVTVNDEVLIKSFEYTTKCLEWFDETALTPLAKKWWDESRKNSKFNTNENICRRITRLLNDLENTTKAEDKEHINNLFDIVVVNQILKVYTSYKPRIVDPTVEFKTSDLEVYENSIRVYSKAVKDINTTLSDIKDNTILYDLLTSLPINYYSQISYSQRLKCIQALCKGNLTSYFIFGNKTELVVFNLLLKTAKADQKQLLDDMVNSAYAVTDDKGNKSYPHLLAKLYNGLDGENFEIFTGELLKWIIDIYPKDNDYTLSSAKNENRFITFASGTWTGQALDKSFTDDGQINLNLRKQFTLSIQDITTAPYNFVYIKFKDQFKYSESLTFNKGQVLALPACYVFALFNQANNSKLTAGLKLAIDVGLCLVGVGEFKAAYEAVSTARKVYLISKATIDLAISVSDIVINDVMVSTLEESDNGKDFLNSWNTFQLYYGVGSIATTGMEALVKKIYKDADELKKLSNISEDVKSKLDDITKKVEDETKVVNDLAKAEGLVNGIRRYNIGDEIANGATTITRQITENGKSITLKWTVDANGIITFGNRSDLAIILGTIEDEAHHILTWTKSSPHSVVQAAAKDGFHLNTFENGIGLAKYRKSLNEGLHGNHPAYDDYVVHKLSEFRRDNPNFTPQSANEYIQKNLIPHMRDLIEDAGTSSYNLNEYFKQIVNPSVGTLLK